MFDYDALCNHHSVTGSTVHSLTHTHTHKQTHNPGDIDLECFMMVVLADGWMDGRGQHGHVDTASKSHQRQPCTPSTTVSTIDMPETKRVPLESMHCGSILRRLCSPRIICWTNTCACVHTWKALLLCDRGEGRPTTVIWPTHTTRYEA